MLSGQPELRSVRCDLSFQDEYSPMLSGQSELRSVDPSLHSLKGITNFTNKINEGCQDLSIFLLLYERFTDQSCYLQHIIKCVLFQIAAGGLRFSFNQRQQFRQFWVSSYRKWLIIAWQLLWLFCPGFVCYSETILMRWSAQYPYKATLCLHFSTWHFSIYRYLHKTFSKLYVFSKTNLPNCWQFVCLVRIIWRGRFLIHACRPSIQWVPQVTPKYVCVAPCLRGLHHLPFHIYKGQLLLASVFLSWVLHASHPNSN